MRDPHPLDNQTVKLRRSLQKMALLLAFSWLLITGLVVALLTR